MVGFQAYRYHAGQLTAKFQIVTSASEPVHIGGTGGIGD